MPTLAEEMLSAARRLCEEVSRLRFGPPVTHVYNPLEYAWGPQRQYIERYGATRKRVVLLGMNPGPFGMTQTGVPFGDALAVAIATRACTLWFAWAIGIGALFTLSRSTGHP